jgi:hypothetical protein
MSMEDHSGMMMMTKENSWFVHQSSLAILPVESSSSKQRKWAIGVRIWPCKVFLFILASDFLHTIKSYNIGFQPYFPSEGRCAVDFYHP